MTRCLLFFLSLLFHQSVCLAQTGAGSIKINQEGYYPSAPKLAVITGDAPASAFYIISVPSKDTVFKGMLSAARQSAYSSTKTKLADFTSLKKK